MSTRQRFGLVLLLASIVMAGMGVEIDADATNIVFEGLFVFLFVLGAMLFLVPRLDRESE